MNSDVAQTATKKSSLKTVLAVLGIIVLIGAMGFAVKLLLSSSEGKATETIKRGTTAEIYTAIQIPSSLKLVEHQSITTGTPSEVYFYTITGDKQLASDELASNLTNSGYSVIKGTNGLIFSASKEGNISLNFTFTDPNQLKVVAI